MSPQLKAKLAAWHESGDETRRRHAAARLAAPEDTAAGPTAPPVPVARSIRAVKLGFRRCLYATSEGCGCSGTHCHHLRRVVGLADCIECLGHARDDRPVPAPVDLRPASGG